MTTVTSPFLKRDVAAEKVVIVGVISFCGTRITYFGAVDLSAVCVKFTIVLISPAALVLFDARPNTYWVLEILLVVMTLLLTHLVCL